MDDLVLPVQPDLQRFLRRALMALRWITLAVLFLITAMQPTPGLVRLPSWVLVLLFAAVSLLVDLLGAVLPPLRALPTMALLTLPVAALLYALAGEPGGPLFVLFFLTVDYAAASMTLRGTLAYVGATVVIVAAIDPLLPLWMHMATDGRMLVARLVTLALVGAGMALLTRRLVLEQQAHRSVRDEAERLETLDQLRADFIATVSHDLRTPLTAARVGLGMLDTGFGDRLPTDERGLLADARLNVERLHRLIDDLLAYNQLEAGILRLERDLIDLRSVVMEALSSVHALVQDKGQRVEVDLPRPLLVNGDAQRLSQVVVNVLANAHRHTPPGTRIALWGRATDAEVVLVVSDSGPGLPPEEVEAVFRRFHRAGSAAGSGLGLAIARGIVELHGGRLWAESAPGQGATFRMALPRHHDGSDA